MARCLPAELGREGVAKVDPGGGCPPPPPWTRGSPLPLWIQGEGVWGGGEMAPDVGAAAMPEVGVAAVPEVGAAASLEVVSGRWR